MWKSRYAASTPMVTTPAQPVTRWEDPARIRDSSRRHAANWMLGAGTLTFAILLALWFIANGLSDWLGQWGPVPVPVIFTVIAPVSLLAGAVAGAYKLIRFTEEYRDWLYQVEDFLNIDLDGDAEIGEPKTRAGEPNPGTLLVAPDGAYHNIDVTLTMAEIAAIKRYLLTEQACSVRGLQAIVGDRASALRSELHRIGVLAQLRNRSATPLTEGGLKAVRRWIVSK